MTIKQHLLAVVMAPRGRSDDGLGDLDAGIAHGAGFAKNEILAPELLDHVSAPKVLAHTYVLAKTTHRESFSFTHTTKI